jgi:glucans biosynthesis protein C
MYLKNSLSSSRQYDLDWIRIIATFIVFLYHCSMFFNPFPWHVKNNNINTSYIFGFSLFVGNWIMPLFFAISGISTYYALKKHESTQYIKERFIRLGIPLLFGVFILSPPQVYMERVNHHQFMGSFLNFIPHYFDGVYLDIGGTGNFAFVGLHLWYLLVLLLFSCLTLPLFTKIKRSDTKAFGWLHFFVLLVPLILVGTFLGFLNLGGWDIVFYLLIYVYGYYYFSNQSFRIFIGNSMQLIGLLAIVTSVIFVVWALMRIPQNGTFLSLLFMVVRVSNCWFWVFFIFSLAAKYLTFTNKSFKYASEASMPFYVLHQPIIVSLGFMICNLNWSVFEKLIFIVPIAFSIILFFYHFIIKKVNGVRTLFGMKENKRNDSGINITINK